jgi:serine phosphatase RsbU (regulator of sigma subunit)
VLADGQGSGQGAKVISQLVARKCIALLSEGVRDGAAARAAHDFLYSLRQGKVSADLNILSIDMVTRTIVLSRNSAVPIFVADAAGARVLDEPSQPIGIYQWTKPAIAEIPIVPETCVVVASDGVPEGGQRFGHPIDLQAELRAALAAADHSAQAIADHLLAVAMQADRGRPADDMSVLVVSISANPSEDGVRRMSVRFPIP